jgi:hypothetical protein
MACTGTALLYFTLLKQSDKRQTIIKLNDAGTISDENFPEKFKSENFLENFPFFIRTVDMVSLFTLYTVIITLIYTSPFIVIGR